MALLRCDQAAALLAAACSCLALTACQQDAESNPRLTSISELRVSAPDVSHDCHDIGGTKQGVRVCWASADKIVLVPQTQPAFDARTALGWRCTGVGEKRTCFDRALGVGPFQCHSQRCEQRRPRVPDANEWSCADASGAQLCSLDAKASGVSEQTTLLGFVCGQRLAGADRTSQKLCIDYSPDFPDGDANQWTCHYEGTPSLTRVCLRKSVHALGARCSAARACAAGALCVSEHCVPQASEPNCWLDGDCPSGRCRLGRCQPNTTNTREPG